MARLGSTPTDELIRRAIIGDGTAFTELWDTHFADLRNYVANTMKNTDDFFVDDVCSRSFEKAFRQIRSYDPGKSLFSTWLKAIAHNTAMDLLESENRNHSRLVPLDYPEANGSVIDKIGDGEQSALENIINVENEEKLQSYIEGLPDIYREVARKRLVDGLKYQEIAEELDMELNTVRTRIRRAKALIDEMKANDE